MNTLFILIIIIPLFEIYLLIKIGSQIGAFSTVALIVSTAVLGVWYAKYEGFNTLKSGLSQIMKNETPIYEIVSGAALALAAVLLIFPGFATDLVGLFLIIPITRKFLLNSFSNKYSKKKVYDKDFIEGESEDLDKKWVKNLKFFLVL